MRNRFSYLLILSTLVLGRAHAATDAECNHLLEDGLSDKNPDTRKQAVAALSLAATRGPAFDRLAGMLADKDLQVKLAAVAGLAELKTPLAIDALRKAMQDDIPEVSFAAAKALWTLHDPRGKEALLSVLQGESKASSSFFSKQKRDTLRMFQTPRVLFLYAARQGIGFAPVPGLGEGISSMQGLLTDPGVSGRAAAALLLAPDESPATLDALRDALLDKDWSVRAAAVHALALHNDPALKPDLEPMLGDAKEAVRLRAAAALLRLNAIAEESAKPPTH